MLDRDARLAWRLVWPALSVVALVAVFPIAWTFWESLHLHDLRMPWLGRPFIFLGNYLELGTDTRFWIALAHTVFFVAVSVSLELTGGLLLAMTLDRVQRSRGFVRTAVLLPWAVPTAVAALVWRFIFESPGGAASAIVRTMGAEAPTWFADATWAWLPLILGDAWKTTPFVAVLLLAGLQNIDRSVYEAAQVDGATAWQRFARITLPLLKPTLAVAALLRTLDAFRVFDVVFVTTGGGPGTATEPIALYTFNTLFQTLRFGYGSALAMVMFVSALLIALLFVRWLAPDIVAEERS